MLQHGWTLRALRYVKEASYKKTNAVWFLEVIYEVPRGSQIHRDRNKMGAARGWGQRGMSWKKLISCQYQRFWRFNKRFWVSGFSGMTLSLHCHITSQLSWVAVTSCGWGQYPSWPQHSWSSIHLPAWPWQCLVSPLPKGLWVRGQKGAESVRGHEESLGR